MGTVQLIAISYLAAGLAYAVAYLARYGLGPKEKASNRAGHVAIDLRRLGGFCLACGEDCLSDHYIRRVVEVLRRDTPTVVTFDTTVHLRGTVPTVCKYSPRFRFDRDKPTVYERRPTHLSVWDRSECVPYLEGALFGEDCEWAARMQAKDYPFEAIYYPLPPSGANAPDFDAPGRWKWSQIDEVLHEYHFDPRDSVQHGTVR